jgi:GNAT superfamily N-acetyltransferase
MSNVIHDYSFEPKFPLPEGFEFDTDRSIIMPEEILGLREEPETGEEVSTWQRCINDSIAVVGVRELATEALVGIAMLSGNARHADLVDLTVHSDVCRRGIGSALVEVITAEARRQNVKYVGLTYDPSKPWLKDFYEKHDYRQVNFAMWLADSLDKH